MNKRIILRWLRCTWIEFKQWLKNPRMILFLVLLVYMHFLVIGPMSAAATELGARLGVFEPFLAICNNTTMMLMFPLFFIVLISDFPRTGADTVFRVHRIGRNIWMASQCGALFLTSVACVLGVFLGCALISLCQGGVLTLQWSDAITYATNHVIQSGRVVNFLPPNIYFQLAQPQALLLAMTLQLLNCMLMGFILLAASVCNCKRVGLVLSTGSVALGMAFVQLGTEAQWIFPAAHFILKQHFTAYFSRPIMPVYLSVVYFLLSILLLALVSYLRLPYHNFVSREGVSK